jgi:hypothetical protein
VMETYQDREREISVDFDGNVTYGEWRVVREWAQTSREPR